jgi:hypothetical protein
VVKIATFAKPENVSSKWRDKILTDISADNFVLHKNLPDNGSLQRQDFNLNILAHAAN